MSSPAPKTGAKQEEVELSNIQNGSAQPSTLPLEEDIMQCARIGALEHIQKMIESGKYKANFKDEEGITPLHWAAINNQYAICKYLLDQGADVNAKGGESNATAAMWAAQRCHFYIVNLMIQHGADLLLVDGQGYNILHLATIDGNAFLLVLLLLQNIPVDVPDPQGHTSLMWAGYKGWPACVDLLLRWGASVNSTDDNGFTPLHWALVKGSKPCLEKLIEYGADRFAKTNDGKTPADCSKEMNSRGPYIRALNDQGYTADGQPKQLPLNLTAFTRDRSKISKFLFLFPCLIMIICAWIISNFSIYIGLPFSIAVGVALQWAAQWIGQQGPPDYHSIHKTPYLAGIFSATLFYVGVDWLWLIMPWTYSKHFFLNLVFGILYGLTAYFYILAMTEDPGYIPKLSSRNQQRDVVQELFSLWKFDEQNFCIQCMIRRPLRSKHCRRCGRCVAKHDHHCPWINSCVGNNNLRHFYLYIICLWFGIVAYVNLVLGYLEALPAPADATCNLLPSYLCTFALRDTWTITLAIWSLMQLVWVSMLVVVQSIQIAKNITTYENMKRHDHSSSHGPSHLPLHNARPTTLGANPASTSLNDTAAAATRIHPASRVPDGMCTKLKKTLGIDVFFATASDASAGKIKDRGNPFSRGVIGNCKDFWCDPAPIFKKRKPGESYLGGDVIDYYTMYERPSVLRRTGAGGMRYERIATEEEAFGVGPLIFAPLSELFGRKPVYAVTMGLAVIFVIPCAVSQNIGTLIVCRLIDGIAFSAPMTLVGGTLSDLWRNEERGVPMAAFSAAPFIGPAIGPLVGGYLADAAGWRWLYWIQLILSGVCWLLLVVTVPETYAPAILKRRAQKLRRTTGVTSYATEQELDKRPFFERLRIFLVRPLQLLFLEPIVLFISLYMSVLYGLLYMFFIAYPIVYQGGKGWDRGPTGLMFIPLAIGVLLSAFCSPFVNKHYLYLCSKAPGGKPPAEARLIPMMFSCWLVPIGLFIFAWTSYPHLSYWGPMMGGAPVGFGFIFLYNSANNYLVDTYQHQAASALAAKTFLRSIWGAGCVLFTEQMYNTMGDQGASSFLAGLALLCCLIPYVFYFKGAAIRKYSKYAFADDDDEKLKVSGAEKV